MQSVYYQLARAEKGALSSVAVLAEHLGVQLSALPW